MYVSAVTSRTVTKSIRSICTTQPFQSSETKPQGLSCGTSIARGYKISVRANCLRVLASNEKGEIQTVCTRRTSLLALTTCIASQVQVPAALSVMGMTAGRIPGFSRLDGDGFRNYTRPEGKSGGHGVGWSEITPYTFRARGCWEETPVSIADPAGTEIDAKFVCAESGDLKIILAPILRFSDKGELELTELVSVDNFIKGFAPELLGLPIQETDLIQAKECVRNERTYYFYELANHSLISATACNKRIYICVLTSSALQWRKSKQDNMALVESFQVLSV